MKILNVTAVLLIGAVVGIGLAALAFAEAGIGDAQETEILTALRRKPEFSDADIEAIKKRIWVEYDLKNATVDDVVMLKKNSNEAVGFVKIERLMETIDLLRNGRRIGRPFWQTMTIPCSATMGENRRYIWQCGR